MFINREPDMWHTYTMKYYLAIKKNEVMPFSATWMDLKSVILRNKSDREGEISYDSPHM